MTPVELYLKRKAELAASGAPTRSYCLRCRKPALTCYCADLTPVATSPRIVVLMHPLEAKHPVGTGRLAHRMLSNSHFFVGINFSEHAGVNALLQDPKLYPLVLYPGAQSRDLSKLNVTERQALLPEDREPVVFLLDGTWNLAKKILTHTPALQTLPRICFTPSRESRFLLRKQPRVQCFSTLEAIHETLTLLSPGFFLR
jgi:DTW domain-containing protein YfiP